jgi:hypothetical protein
VYLDELVPKLKEGSFGCRESWLADGSLGVASIDNSHPDDLNLVVFRNGFRYALVHDDIIAGDWQTF